MESLETLGKSVALLDKEEQNVQDRYCEICRTDSETLKDLYYEILMDIKNEREVLENKIVALLG